MRDRQYYLNRVRQAVESGAFFNPFKESTNMAKNRETSAANTAATASNANDNAHDDLLTTMVDPSQFADELGAGEFIKKPQLAEMGFFSLVDAYKRNDQYKGRNIEQVVFEVQLLEGDNKGAKALCSFENNPVRDKMYKVVKRLAETGKALGPYRLVKQKNAKEQEAYVFEQRDGNTPF